MATHRISFPHATRSTASPPRTQVSRTQEQADPNFGLFMLAPVIIALTIVAISWISRVSF